MKLIKFDEVDSTNTYLKNNYLKYSNFTFVLTNYQSEGKGRFGRTFEVLKDQGLMFSFLLKSEKYLSIYHLLPIIIATTIATTLDELHDLKTKIKWPNDIYINNLKVSGILLEGISNESLEGIVCGVGINLFQENFNDSSFKATSLKLETKTPIEKEVLFEKLIMNLQINIENFLYKIYDPIKIINIKNYLFNKKCFAKINNDREEITVLNINNQGFLRVQRSDGEISEIDSGEITFKVSSN